MKHSGQNQNALIIRKAKGPCREIASRLQPRVRSLLLTAAALGPVPPAAGAADPPCAALRCGTGLRLRRLCPNASEKKANVVFPSGRAARAAPIASSSRRSRQLNPGDGQQRRRDPSVVPTHPDPGSALPPLYGEQQLEVGHWNTSSQRH